MRVSKCLDENIKSFKKLYEQCSDIKQKELKIGLNGGLAAFIAYIEVTVQGTAANQSALGKMLSYLEDKEPETIPEIIKQNQMGLSDLLLIETVEEAAQMMLTGDPIVFVDGLEYAMKIPDRGYPAMAVSETDSEKVVRGSNEGFADSIKINTALIRRRLRSTRLKCREIKKGLRGHNNVNILYIRDLARGKVIDEIERNLSEYVIDNVPDTGVIEQLGEQKWYSPFPQYQTTKRPDVAVMALLEGRVVILSDNSPVAIIAPVSFNSFMKTADDYYNRSYAASLARVIRYTAACLAMGLPGLYLAVTNFHTQILPTPLLLAFWEARAGCPFPQVLEVILMELSFELLREAGIRLPGALGNTIGIVGGLIIGQSAVEAQLVSPIVVILVAFTALCSFAIPNEELAFSFRLIKFAVIVMCAWLGFLGFLLATFVVLIHLGKLESFGYPYLMPFAGGSRGEGDSLLRWPTKSLHKRPAFSNEDERTKLRFLDE